VAVLHRPLPDAAAFPAGEGLPRHDPTAEALVVDRWLRPVTRWGLLPPLADETLDELLGPLLHDPPTAPSLLHRDLHDKQVVLEPDGRIGLLDLDTASVGEPALDIANVLAHLDLRQRQGLLTPMAAATARSAFLDGASPGPATMARVPVYGVAAQLRLAAVYALRPPWRVVAASLLASLGTPTTHGPGARQRRRCSPPPLSARR
jgi:Ser/Thr protein kinase RdoA (MazF antagonist)